MKASQQKQCKTLELINKNSRVDTRCGTKTHSNCQFIYIARPEIIQINFRFYWQSDEKSLFSLYERTIRNDEKTIQSMFFFCNSKQQQTTYWRPN